MAQVNFTTPGELKSRLRKYWEKGKILSDFLRESSEGEMFPLRFTIRRPSSREIAANFEDTRAWAEQWKNQSILPVEWQQFSHQIFGPNELPAAVVIKNAEMAVKILGVQNDWNRFAELVALCDSRLPQLRAWLRKRPMNALSLFNDFTALIAVLEWIRNHPKSRVYLRQIDAPGVHTKLVEQHRKELSEMLDLILPEEEIDASAPAGIAGFVQRYGFRPKPLRIRFRFLDPQSAIAAAQLGRDLSIDASAFAHLNPEVERVFITENEINFLAFPDSPRSLLIFGAGYGWEALGDAHWLHDKEMYYWGDLDTHGFAILNQLRASFPKTHSFLMEREILLQHRALWTEERKPVTHELTRLRSKEADALALLRSCPDGFAPRLEQEKIPFSQLDLALQHIDPYFKETRTR